MTYVNTYPKFKAWDRNGDPLVGGQVFSYVVGTDTPTSTFSDVACTIANTNPVILDAMGEADLFISGTVKLVVKDALDNLLFTVNEAAGSILWTFSPASAGVLYSSCVYGASQVILEAAIAAVSASNATLYVTPGNWPITTTTVPANITLKPERGALFVITGTMTINGGFDAGSYQTFSCGGPGEVVFAAGQIVNAAWFGLDGGGVVDNQTALTKALAATPTNGVLEIPQPATSYALASTWVIDKAVHIVGRGLSHVVTSALSGTTAGVKVNWTGSASAMISATSIVGATIDNLALDGNATATYGLYFDRLAQGGGTNLTIRNVATTGLWLGATANVATDNADWNKFTNLNIYDVPNMITLDGYNHTNIPADACHNTFVQVRGTFTGAYGINLLGCDNNSFYDTYIYRSSGTGYGVHFSQYAVGNYFYHLQAPVNIAGAKSVLVAASCPGNTIFGYDMLNGAALPEITATGKLSYYSQGTNSFGDFPEQYNMAGDILYNTINGEAMRWEDYDTGHKFKFLLNPSTRKVEFWADASGSGYIKILEVSNASVHVTTTDLTIDTVAKGVVMTNAAGTVTKRVRLNDAGNGLIYETP